jgi:GxxExxY protein
MDIINTIVPKIYFICNEVQRKLGPKHCESIYANVLAKYIEKKIPGAKVKREKKLNVIIDDEIVGSRYIDIYVETCIGNIILELKHISTYSKTAEDQVKYYLELDDSAEHAMLIFFNKEAGFPSKNDPPYEFDLKSYPLILQKIENKIYKLTGSHYIIENYADEKKKGMANLVVEEQ